MVSKIIPVLLIQGAMLIDGTGTPKQGPLDIEIRGNRISKIAPQLQNPRAVVIDARGKTIVPGLIDAHTHLRSVPGDVYRNDADSKIEEQQLFQMKAYLAAGVTTVLDAATPAKLFSDIQELQEKHSIPRVMGLAPFLTPKGGYFSGPDSRGKNFADLWPAVDSREEIIQALEKAKPLHPLGVKVTVEYGFGPFRVWPVFSPELRKAIVEEAGKAQLPILVHSESEEEFEEALLYQPYAFVHGGFYQGPPSAEIIEKIQKSKAYVVSTLAIFKMMLLMWQQEALNEPWLKSLVPENQRETAKNLEIRTQVIERIVLQNTPSYIPQFLAKWASGLFMNRKSVQKNLLASEKAILQMYQAGVPLVMGSDAGNWPVFTTFFHGVGSIFEMEALQEAGIPPLEVIHAATGRSAQMLKIDHEVGTIQIGMVADLLVLNQDPLTSKEAFRDIQYVIKGGIAKRPIEWLR